MIPPAEEEYDAIIKVFAMKLDGMLVARTLIRVGVMTIDAGAIDDLLGDGNLEDFSNADLANVFSLFTHIDTDEMSEEELAA